MRISKACPIKGVLLEVVDEVFKLLQLPRPTDIQEIFLIVAVVRPLAILHSSC